MSGVPKSKRGQSSVEYVWQAQILFHQTFECALRLPKLWTFFKTTLPTSKKMVRYPATPPPDARTNRRA
jgi:hypothetical protein